ncbi:MAG: hypothetical protein WAL50_08020 [Kineosporiaceae bacterium]
MVEQYVVLVFVTAWLSNVNVMAIAPQHTATNTNTVEILLIPLTSFDLIRVEQEATGALGGPRYACLRKRRM